MKSHKGLFVITISLLLVVSCSITVLAYMLQRTPTKENTFTPATLDCALQTNKDTDGNLNSVTVKNNGNVSAYLRVTMVSYWVDGGGNIVGRASTLPTFSVKTGWIKGSTDIYYYQAPIAAKDATPELLADKIILATDGEYKQVLDVLAEAIQAMPTDAVTEAWGVTVEGGNITAAP